jgi:hypothetical protein
MEWISIKDRLPEKGSSVIAFDGKVRQICFWIPKHYEEFECDEEDCDLFDYDEPNDKTYWTEGWYSDEEQFGGTYDSYWVKRNITHWMELPEPPKQ